MQEVERRIDTLRLLIARLERLSADSYWAHKASGLRGSLLRYMEQIENDGPLHDQDWPTLDALITMGFVVLEKAAKEISVPNH